MKTRSLSLLLSLLTLCPATESPYDFTPLDQHLAGVARNIATGFEIAVVQNGELLYAKSFGPWRRDQQALIASATKWLSGAVILSLVDEGALRLDDPASKYLPYLNGEKASITIRQLMSHTAGFPGEFPLADPCLEDPTGTLDDCARALARVPLKAPPGTAFIYSGAGMQIAGRVAEAASGKDWQTLFRERIAQPLGMTATDYEYRGPTRNPRISGGARSCLSDYMRFLTMIRQRGLFEGRRVLSTRAIDEMLRDQTRGVPIVESPFERVEGNFRYGIGNWVENPDWRGRAEANNSIGVAGWTPLLDESRNLQVVVAMQNVRQPFQPYYLETKAILQSTIPPAPLTPRGITNAASYEAGPIAPGQLLTVFGRGLAPGARVTFDGVSGAVLFSSEDQINVQAPAELAGKTEVRVEVIAAGRTFPAVLVPVAEAWPALFTADGSGSGPAAALNADRTIHSPANPARRGAEVTLFGTGACMGSGAAPLPEVWVGDRLARTVSCAPAAGLAPGVFQITAILPADAPTGDPIPVVIRLGHASSPPVVTLAIE